MAVIVRNLILATINASRHSRNISTALSYKHSMNNVEILKQMSKNTFRILNNSRIDVTTTSISAQNDYFKICTLAPPLAQQKQIMHRSFRTVMQCFGAKMLALNKTITKKSFCPLFSSFLAVLSRSTSVEHEFSHTIRKKSTWLSKTMEQFIIKSSKTNNEDNDKKESSVNSKTYFDDRLFEMPSMFVRHKPETNHVLKIIVEGNIGSGKTTFLSIFAKNCSKLCHDSLIVPEPVDLWRDVGGVNIFQLLADDPNRWSFTFQSYVQLTMLKVSTIFKGKTIFSIVFLFSSQIHELMPEKGNVKVMERSLYSARYCFVENLLQKKLLSTCEYYVLNQWFNNCLPAAQIDLIIYLRTDPDIVFERIQKRGRPEESKITLDYLRSLHDLHEDWLVRKKFPLPAPVLTIDANTPLEDLVNVYEEQTGGILREHRLLV